MGLLREPPSELDEKKDLTKKPLIFSRFWRLNHLYKVINKDGEEVIFLLNQGQQMLYDKELELRKLTGRVRLKILKSRQIGFTTYKLIDKLDKCLFYKNTNVNIVAHSREKMQEIFKKVKFIYEHIPDKVKMSDGRVWSKPVPKYDNVNEYFFSDMNSTIKITLDSRSGTLTDCHISEGAYIEGFRDMLRATIPSAERADITIETTANGMNEFKEFWDKDDRFVPMFFPRFTDLEYQREAPVGWKCILELRYIQDKFHLTDAQMYRYEEKYKNDKDGTLQEYPSEPIDAFLASGRPFYDLQKVKDYPIKTGVEDEFNRGLIWYNKNKTQKAIFGLDFSEGLEHGDKSTIRVRDRNLKLICTYRGIQDPADIAKIVNYIWECGIQGVIGPESNNHGHTFLYVSKSYKWYDNIYIPKKDNEDNDFNRDGRRGWLTNLVTRPLMLDEHKELVKSGLMEMDKELQDEIFTFIIKNRKPQADTNCHDDVIMADAICCQMVKEPVEEEDNYVVSQPNIGNFLLG